MKRAGLAVMAAAVTIFVWTVFAHAVEDPGPVETREARHTLVGAPFVPGPPVWQPAALHSKAGQTIGNLEAWAEQIQVLPDKLASSALAIFEEAKTSLEAEGTPF